MSTRIEVYPLHPPRQEVWAADLFLSCGHIQRKAIQGPRSFVKRLAGSLDEVCFDPHCDGSSRQGDLFGFDLGDRT